jgi:hypothetical protein
MIEPQLAALVPQVVGIHIGTRTRSFIELGCDVALGVRP